MAGKLTIWGTTPAEGIRDALAEAGIETGFVDYHSGSKPPIMDGGTLLVLGSSTVDELARQGVVAKNRTVTSLRSDTHQWNNNKVRVSYSPAMKNLNSAFYTDFLTDLVLAVRLAVTGSIDPELGKYKYVESFSDYCNQLHELSKDKIVPIVFDTETIGLDYLHLGDSTRPAARLVSLQLTIKAGEAHVVYFGSMAEQTEWFTKYRSQMEYLLNSPRLSMGGANFTYDLKWIRHFTGITSSNFKFDTTLVGSLLDENRSNSLSTHTKLYVPSLGGYSDAFDARTDKSRMDLVNKKDLLDYGGGDTDACYQVRQRMTQELKKDPKLATFYIKVLHPAQKAFGEAEFNGVHVDMDRYAVLETDLNKVLNEATRKAAEAVGGRIFAKHKDESKMGGINITKASLIKDFMFSPMGLNLKPRMTTAKSGAPSTAREHIEMFSDIPEAKAFVDAFKEYGSAAKMLSTYVTGFQKHLRSDGRFHPSYFLFMGDKQAGEGGTVTGRLSARNPAFQCLKGSSLIVAKGGEKSILSIVEGYEAGETFEVMTHAGMYKPVVGVYRNGIKPVFKVTLQSGKSITCTGNHPLLTEAGFAKTENLLKRDKVFVYDKDYMAGHSSRLTDWTVDSSKQAQIERTLQSGLEVQLWDGSDSGFQLSNSQYALQVLWLLQKGQAHNAWSLPQAQGVIDLLGMAAHDKQMREPEQQRLQRLWSKGHNYLDQLEGVLRAVPIGYGGETQQRILGAIGCKWELLCNQLHLGKPNSASTEPQEHNRCDVAGEDQALSSVVRRTEPVLRSHLHTIQTRVDYGSSSYHAHQAAVSGFKTEEIISIEYVGEEETFDLTVEEHHSFVANGIVVHNTLPKHSYWGKRIRSCMTAPEGFLVTEKDYSQGELKVVACMADERNMIKAYREGKDLHVLTAALVNDMTYDHLLGLKATDYDLYDSLRSNGKAGNFGLLYGMSAAGFQAYAATVYGVHMTLQEAEDFRTAYLYKSYPALPDYHEVYKEMARTKGYITSPLGRKRHLPLARSRNQESRSGAERQAINSGVQSTLSDMLCWAMAISHERGHTQYAPCFGAIHDATYNYVPEDDWEKWVKKDLEIMENLPLDQVGWNPQLNFTADAKIGKSMGELEDCTFT